jgi:uncharacterized C2H2 Zn-finger protein
MISVKCPHDNAELKLVEDKKIGDYLECPKCKCIFRVCLAVYNKDCYTRMQGIPKKRKRKKDEGEMIQKDE